MLRLTSILNNLQNKNPLFLCVIASTKISNIPGITGAGATPELTDYTPAADVELVIRGEPKCLAEIPKTVIGGEAAPTPALITKASLEIADIPIMVAVFPETVALAPLTINPALLLLVTVFPETVTLRPDK